MILLIGCGAIMHLHHGVDAIGILTQFRQAKRGYFGGVAMKEGARLGGGNYHIVLLLVVGEEITGFRVVYPCYTLTDCHRVVIFGSCRIDTIRGLYCTSKLR